MNLYGALLVLLHVALAGGAALHALLYKRDSRAATGWIAVSILFPIAGPALYFFFGVNRVKTRARALRGRWNFKLGIGFERGAAERQSPAGAVQVPPGAEMLARVAGSVTRQPLVCGNSVEILESGATVYERMLTAIGAAQQYVYLATYIFDSGAAGRRLVDALAGAAARGVRVRVLLDGVGEFYSWPGGGRLLQRRGVTVARFLPPRLVPPQIHLNLRNHRKILVVDGETGFTGGMNIRAGHASSDPQDPHRVADLHFALCGPVLEQIEQAFVDDWSFAAGEELPAPPQAAAQGNACCRVITDGPNEDLDMLQMVLLGVISAARRRVLIVTPYFVPARELVSALQAAVLRGVQVDIVLPARNNLPFVHWATRNLLWELLQWGVNVYYQPPPFAHTKLLVIDGGYSMIGSANLDPRSLRLNFELVVEIFCEDFARALELHADAALRSSAAVTLAEMDARPFLQRVRDALAWLASPYL